MKRNNITILKKLFKLILWEKLFCVGDLNSYILEILSKETRFEVEVAMTLPNLSEEFLSKGNFV